MSLDPRWYNREVPTHLRTEDKVFLFLTVKHIFKLIVVGIIVLFVYSLGFMQALPPHMRLIVAGAVGTVFAMMLILEIGGRPLPKVILDFVSYFVTPRRYRGVLYDLASPQPLLDFGAMRRRRIPAKLLILRLKIVRRRIRETYKTLRGNSALRRIPFIGLSVLLTITVAACTTSAFGQSPPSPSAPSPVATALIPDLHEPPIPFFAPGRRVYLERAKLINLYDTFPYHAENKLDLTLRASTPIERASVTLLPLPDEEYIAELALTEEDGVLDLTEDIPFPPIQAFGPLGENSEVTLRFALDHLLQLNGYPRSDIAFEGFEISWRDIHGYESTLLIEPQYLPFPAPIVEQTYDDEGDILWYGGLIATATPLPNVTPIPYILDVPREDRPFSPSFCRIVAFAQLEMSFSRSERHVRGKLIADCPLQSENNAQLTVLNRDIVIDQRDQEHIAIAGDNITRIEDVYLSDAPLICMNRLLFMPQNAYRPRSADPYLAPHGIPVDGDCTPGLDQPPIIDFAMPIEHVHPRRTQDVFFQLRNIYHIEFAYPPPGERLTYNIGEDNLRYIPIPQIVETLWVDNPQCAKTIDVHHTTVVNTYVVESEDPPPSDSHTTVQRRKVTAQEIFDGCVRTDFPRTPAAITSMQTPVPTPVVQRSQQYFEFTLTIAHDDEIKILKLLTPTPSPTPVALSDSDKRRLDTFDGLMSVPTARPAWTPTPTSIPFNERAERDRSR